MHRAQKEIAPENHRFSSVTYRTRGSSFVSTPEKNRYARGAGERLVCVPKRVRPVQPRRCNEPPSELHRHAAGGAKIFHGIARRLKSSLQSAIPQSAPVLTCGIGERRAIGDGARVAQKGNGTPKNFGTAAFGDSSTESEFLELRRS